MSIKTKGHGLPEITVKELRERLMALDKTHDHKPVHVWLPGSRIILADLMGAGIDSHAILIEGNVAPGSALES